MKAEIGKWYLFAFVPWARKMMGEVIRIEEDKYQTYYVMKVHKQYIYDEEGRVEVGLDEKGSRELTIRSHHIIKEMSKSDVLMECLDD